MCNGTFIVVIFWNCPEGTVFAMDSLNNIEQSQIPLRKACDKLIIVTNSE
jgi:hypothetical protein